MTVRTDTISGYLFGQVSKTLSRGSAKSMGKNPHRCAVSSRLKICSSAVLLPQNLPRPPAFGPDFGCCSGSLSCSSLVQCPTWQFSLSEVNPPTVFQDTSRGTEHELGVVAVLTRLYRFFICVESRSGAFSPIAKRDAQ